MQKQEQQLVQALIEQLTIEEKIQMIHGAGLFRTGGVSRLDLPPLRMSDGPMGVRAEFADDKWEGIGEGYDEVSYLPSNSAVAATWNPHLARVAGEVLGAEARGRGKDVILAPGINIKRSPLCGRNFEYMSEDPYLIETLVVPMIKGIQQNDVAACVKHFAANSQETNRSWVDTKVDERALQEIYFPGFKAAVKKADTYALMGAYNQLNGEHCCTSKALLNKVLREQWEYEGTIISDWGGVHDTQLAAESALDIEMDVKASFEKYYMANALLEKVKKGEIAEAFIDEKVRHILEMMLRLKMIGAHKTERKSGTYNTRAHQEALLEVARESVILLKNESYHLPLQKEKLKTIAVIGSNATTIHSNGGGSAEIKALYEITPLMGIKTLLGGNVEVKYAKGYDVPIWEEDTSWQETSVGIQEEASSMVQELKLDTKKTINQETSQLLREEALKIAKEADEVIFIGGLNHQFDVEGVDRENMRLPYKQDELIAALLEINPETVIVLYAGAPVEMPWLERAKNLVWSYYAGMEGGRAIAEVLFGMVNPSGKLPETFIKKVTDCPAHFIGEFGKRDCVTYTEGIMVGYRYYDTYETPVAFPFGYGLSYTSFSYKALEVNKKEESQGVEVLVTVRVGNEGDVTGKEIIQLYIGDIEASVIRPGHELKAYQKVELLPGEVKEVQFILDAGAFSFYDEQEKCFRAEAGKFLIEVGSSSRAIQLTQAIDLEWHHKLQD